MVHILISLSLTKPTYCFKERDPDLDLQKKLRQKVTGMQRVRNGFEMDSNGFLHTDVAAAIAATLKPPSSPINNDPSTAFADCTNQDWPSSFETLLNVKLMLFL